MGNPHGKRAPADPSPPEAAEHGRARDQLLRLLSYRPRSVREVRRRLREQGYSPHAIERVVREAQANGWLDDAAFAKLWVEDRLMTNPKGPFALRQELRAKGVDEVHIERALAEADIDEAALIEALIERHKARYQGDAPETRRRKLVALLRRRGFSLSAIRKTLKERDEP